jgi:hypothetical protein
MELAGACSLVGAPWAVLKCPERPASVNHSGGFMGKRKGKKKKEILGITEEFVGEVAAMSSQGMKETIARYEAEQDTVNNFLKTNDIILEAKANLDELTASSKETLKVLKNRKKFLVDELKKAGEYTE